MIQVNLLPGGKKRSGGGFSFGSIVDSIKRFGAGGGTSLDPYKGFFGVAAAVAVIFMGLSFTSVLSETEELEVQEEAAVQDSIRNAAIIQSTRQLRARGDSIQERVRIIQDIDAGRYTWPHLLDEIASAVPDFTWLREVTYQGDSPLQVRITGRAGSIYAITSFMRRLEASRFLRSVRAETMLQIPSEANPEDLVYRFELLVTYSAPGIDALETVPLFENVTAQAQTAGTGN